MKAVVQNPKLQGVREGRRHIDSEEVIYENPHIDSHDQEAHGSKEKFHQRKHDALVPLEWAEETCALGRLYKSSYPQTQTPYNIQRGTMAYNHLFSNPPAIGSMPMWTDCNRS